MADPRFPPVQGGPARPGPNTSRSGKIPLLPIALLVFYGLYIGVLIIAPVLSKDFEETLDGFFPPNFRFIVGGILLGVFALILVLNLLDRSTPKGPPQIKRTVPESEANKFKPVQPAQARIVTPSPQTSTSTQVNTPQAAQVKKDGPIPMPQPPKKTIVTYPSEVEGGIYGETFIELGQQKVLKLRSIVVDAIYLN